MALSSVQGTTVGTAAVKLAENVEYDVSKGGNPRPVILGNTSGGTVYLGGSAVTTANGFRWLPSYGGALSYELQDGEELWGVASTNQTVDILYGGFD